MELVKKVFLVTLALFLIDCASSPNFREIHSRSKDILAAAKALQKEGKTQEAYRLLQIVQKMYPNDPEVKQIMTSFSKEQINYVDQGWFLGFNNATRAQEKAGILKRILMYIPDRFLDIFDLVDVWINIGPQFGVSAKATSVFQGEAFAGAYTGFGFGQNKMWGAKVEKRGSFAIGPLGITDHSSTTVGTGSFQVGEDYLYVHTPGKQLYKEEKDYWSFGAQAGGLFLGWEIQIHPMEILDLALGFLFIDLLDDDISRTRALDYNITQRYLPVDYLKLTKYLDDAEISRFQKKYPTIAVEKK
ncbi:MAG: hypothetical protein AAF518_02175 [Spirochaetota bacterium]